MRKKSLKIVFILLLVWLSSCNCEDNDREFTPDEVLLRGKWYRVKEVVNGEVHRYTDGTCAKHFIQLSDDYRYYQSDTVNCKNSVGDEGAWTLHHDILIVTLDDGTITEFKVHIVNSDFLVLESNQDRNADGVNDTILQSFSSM